jgi:hypothetical protein
MSQRQDGTEEGQAHPFERQPNPSEREKNPSALKGSSSASQATVLRSVSGIPTSQDALTTNEEKAAAVCVEPLVGEKISPPIEIEGCRYEVRLRGLDSNPD